MIHDAPLWLRFQGLPAPQVGACHPP